MEDMNSTELKHWLFQFFSACHSLGLPTIIRQKPFGRVITDELVFTTGLLVPDSQERLEIESFLDNHKQNLLECLDKAKAGTLTESDFDFIDIHF